MKTLSAVLSLARRPSLRRLAPVGAFAALLGGFTGCSTTYTVMIDAINNPAKPMGTSYQLEVIDPAGGVDKELGVLAIAHGKDALAARGMIEAPAGTKPDMIIELEYGRGPGQTALVYRPPYKWPREPSPKLVVEYEKYLQLTAREPAAATGAAPPTPPGKPGKQNGDELWSVRVAVTDEEKSLSPYLPVLSSVMVEAIGKNSGEEKHIEVDPRKAAAALPHPRPVPSPK